MYVRARLGQLPIDPSGDTSFNYPDTFGSTPTSGGDVVDEFWNWVIASESTSTALGKASIQSVVTNAQAANAAAQANGQPPPYDIAAIQAEANRQTQAFVAEVPQLWKPDLKDPSTWPWYYWAGIIGVGILWAVKR
jgi:hypothetical protein